MILQLKTTARQPHDNEEEKNAGKCWCEIIGGAC
jgi:hypothetical protein